MMKIDAVVPREVAGLLKAELPLNVMKRLKGYIETAQDNPSDTKSLGLAGNISKSLDLVDKDGWFYQYVLIPLINKYTETFPGYSSGNFILTNDAPYTLNRFWVNFQKENEFNPFHNHSGLWSFVVWVKIPTDWREQHALPISANSTVPCASDFGFLYTSMMGDMQYYSYPLDKESEGHMLFFPSKLMHGVYPFYNCDEERISISGNIYYEN
jgi:hypothetical protein